MPPSHGFLACFFLSHAGSMSCVSWFWRKHRSFLPWALWQSWMSAGLLNSRNIPCNPTTFTCGAIYLQFSLCPYGISCGSVLFLVWDRLLMCCGSLLKLLWLQRNTELRSSPCSSPICHTFHECFAVGFKAIRSYFTCSLKPQLCAASSLLQPLLKQQLHFLKGWKFFLTSS